MDYVVLEIRIPDNWVGEISQSLPHPLRFIECKPSGEAGGRSLVEINAHDMDPDAIINSIRNHPGVCSVDVTPLRDGVVLGKVTLEKCVACQALTRSDCFLLSAETVDSGNIEWNLITGGEGSLLQLVKKLEEAGCEVKLKAVSRLDRKRLLTERQGIVLRTAFERGYYEVPKRTSVKELAAVFGVSPSTIAEILQKGERKVMEQHFRS